MKLTAEADMSQSRKDCRTQPAPLTNRRQIFAAGPDFWRFLGGLARRFLEDLCLQRAAALSYTSVMSLVPAAGVSLAFLSTLPQSDEIRSAVEDLLTRYLLPHAGETALMAFHTLLLRAASLSALGFAGLLVTAMMLLITINSAFNTIWRVTRPRPLMIRLLAYWAILTIGPMLIGIALSLSGPLLATGERYGGSAFTWFMPIVPELGAFTLLYHIVPNCRVYWRDSLVGGILASALFEGVKQGFALYVAWFSSYDALYGALAAIPVSLLWIYLCWIATLAGAELAAAMRDWRARVCDEFEE